MQYVIFTDLDGTLLDHESYSYQAALPALEAIRQKAIPLILCTSKTRSEVEAIRAELGVKHPFIVENGAAAFVPRGYFPFATRAQKSDGDFDVIELGIPYASVTAALRRAAEASGCPVRGFHEMTPEEVAERCQMSVPEAKLAKIREYDEPFEALSENPDVVGRLFSGVESEGLTWTRGGRFYHIRGRHNKGQAAEMLFGPFRRLNRTVVTVGLGDGPNDISLLSIVDIPIVLPQPHRQNHWSAGTGSWRVAPHPGPRGWNEAVLQVLAQGQTA